MRFLKRIVAVSALVALAVLDALLYWNYHLYDRARRDVNLARKVSLLENSKACFPLNDLVSYELGKSYLEMGMGEANDATAREFSLRESVQDLKRSILDNPASPFAHFYLAQSLSNLGLLSAGTGTAFYEEFRKAALLAGEDSEIFFAVGRAFLSRWSELSASDRDFTLEILTKILGKKDRESFALILETWALNVGDYRIIEGILPEDARTYRQYAQFLGEKSLAVEERHRYLARAEVLEFAAAQSEFQSGENELYRFRVRDAREHFQNARNLLGEIRFFQPPPPEEESVGRQEFLRLSKSLSLDLAKCRLEDGEDLQGISGELTRYLSYEDQGGGAAALERYLKDKEAIPDQLGDKSRDFGAISLELLLLSKQEKYDEIITFSRGLEHDLIVVPPEQKRSYLRVLQIAGDAFQEAGLPIEAETFYRKALEIEPTNLDTWLSVRRNRGRQQDDKRLCEADSEVERLLTPPSVDLKNIQLDKGQIFKTPLFLEGRKIVLDICFENGGGAVSPLVYVAFNNRAVCDDYTQSGIITVVLDTQPGGNVLQITPVNGPMTLVALRYRRQGDAENRPRGNPGPRSQSSS